MKILVTGSRGWDKPLVILEALQGLDGNDDFVLIHGGAKGADDIAGRAARKLKWIEKVIPADWDTHGKSAGPIRNNLMLDMQPDLVLAFWDGKSRGTEQCFTEAVARGIPTTVYHINGTVGKIN